MATLLADRRDAIPAAVTLHTRSPLAKRLLKEMRIFSSLIRRFRQTASEIIALGSMVIHEEIFPGFHARRDVGWADTRGVLGDDAQLLTCPICVDGSVCLVSCVSHRVVP